MLGHYTVTSSVNFEIPLNIPNPVWQMIPFQTTAWVGYQVTPGDRDVIDD